MAAECDVTDDGYQWSGSDATAVVRAVVDDLGAGVERSLVAYKFHRGVADFVVSTCRPLRDRTGIDTVALSGGVFQNRLLVELLLPMLDEQRFTVLRQSQIPPNDGGVSLGQVAIGRAHLARSH